MNHNAKTISLICLSLLLSSCTLKEGGLPNVFSSYDRDVAQIEAATTGNKVIKPINY